MTCFSCSVSFFGRGSGASGSVSKTSTLLFLIVGCFRLWTMKMGRKNFILSSVEGVFMEYTSPRNSLNRFFNWIGRSGYVASLVARTRIGDEGSSAAIRQRKTAFTVSGTSGHHWSIDRMYITDGTFLAASLNTCDH